MQNMSRFLMPLVIAVVSVALVSGAPAQTQTKTKTDDSKAVVTDWNAFLCKDIMRMSGDERIIALSLLNGYYMGKKGDTAHSAGSMGKASDDFTEYCLDNPQAKALETFGKFVK